LGPVVPRLTLMIAGSGGFRAQTHGIRLNRRSSAGRVARPALSALAGATTRIRLQTGVLLAPLRSTALLGAQAATLDRLSRGRFTLGLGLGGRTDDYAAAGVTPHGLGARLDAQMTQLRAQWAGTRAIGPAPFRADGPEVLFGAFREPALARIARFGDGLHCAAPSAWASGLFASVERHWTEAGRAGRPRFVGQLNVALGPEQVVDAARASLAAYYAFTGTPERMTAGLLTTPGSVTAEIRAFSDLGADEVVCYCWATHPDQSDRIADLTV
jgi:alkanesulfonate monooxygenase SsuD/methylene tetrahydromethanopterin reductase-like flavin-dependent oxidoreductase (luciferase family)